MALTYKWIVSSLDCVIKETVDGTELENVVNMVHWRRSVQTADYDPTVLPVTGYYTDVYGALPLTNPDPKDFVKYSDITQVKVESWLNDMTDPTKVEIDKGLATSIALLQNPVEETLPLPF